MTSQVNYYPHVTKEQIEKRKKYKEKMKRFWNAKEKIVQNYKRM